MLERPLRGAFVFYAGNAIQRSRAGICFMDLSRGSHYNTGSIIRSDENHYILTGTTSPLSLLLSAAKPMTWLSIDWSMVEVR